MPGGTVGVPDAHADRHTHGAEQDRSGMCNLNE
jgi:hypothetical protein